MLFLNKAFGAVRLVEQYTESNIRLHSWKVLKEPDEADNFQRKYLQGVLTILEKKFEKEILH